MGPTSVRRRIADRLATWGARLACDRRGTTALEFAVTGLAFLGVVLFVVALGFRLYVQVALDYAAARAARLLAVDGTQSLSASAQHFQTASFCPVLAPFLPCNGVTLSLQPVTTFLNASTIGPGTPPFNPGQGGSLELLQVQYAVPALSWPLPGGGAGSFTGRLVVASYPYQNEY